jgi:putative ABC transport system permease protein
MRSARLLLAGFAAMRRFKLRSAAMVLGSLVGVAALTLVVSVGRGVERKVLATVRQIFGESSVMVVAGGTNVMSGPRPGAARLTLDDIEAVAREIPDVEVWDAQQILPGATVKRGQQTATARVLGQTERSPRVWSRGVSYGEFFDAAAVASSSRVAVIGETVARELFGSEDPIGAEVFVGGVPFRVIGVLERFGTDLHGMDRDDELAVPLTTAMRRLLNVDTIASAKLLVRSPDRVAPVARDAKRVLREKHALSAGQPDDFSFITTVQVRRMVAKVRRVLFLFLPLVAGVSLLTGAAVSAALMLSSVSSRVSEIGIRRAVGARPEDIRLQFLLESTAAALTGGLVGIALGGALAAFAASRMHLGGVLSWQAAVIGVAVSCAVGLAAGVLPARRAAALPPAEALAARG